MQHSPWVQTIDETARRYRVLPSQVLRIADDDRALDFDLAVTIDALPGG